MDYTQILDALSKASLFELYRLNVAIGNLLDDPARILAVKRTLQVGQVVSWLNSEENRLVEARLLQINRSRALIQDIASGKRWTIPFHLINVDQHEIEIAAGQRGKLDRNRLKVGDRVAFRDKAGHERFGEVIKLNTKTASVQVGPSRWRVHYSLLQPVIDGELGAEGLALPGVWSRVEQTSLDLEPIEPHDPD